MIYGVELIMSITYVFSDDLRRKRETRTVLEDDPGDDVEVTSPEPTNTYTITHKSFIVYKSSLPIPFCYRAEKRL